MFLFINPFSTNSPDVMKKGMHGSAAGETPAVACLQRCGPRLEPNPGRRSHPFLRGRQIGIWLLCEEKKKGKKINRNKIREIKQWIVHQPINHKYLMSYLFILDVALGLHFEMVSNCQIIRKEPWHMWIWYSKHRTGRVRQWSLIVLLFPEPNELQNGR